VVASKSNHHFVKHYAFGIRSSVLRTKDLGTMKYNGVRKSVTCSLSVHVHSSQFVKNSHIVPCLFLAQTVQRQILR
jgi:hypothetical protein